MRSVAAALVLVLATVPATALDGRRLHVRDGRLVDHRNREITLRGVNARVDGVFDVTFSDGRLPLEPIPVFDAVDAARMQSFGFDFLRLPINWSALEPVRGQYDKTYLDRIAAVVDACAAHDVAVLIDFHQDAFSKEIGEDGAPRWVLDLLLGPNGYPFLGGPLGDLTARRFSAAALGAGQRFFANDQGIQDAYAAAVVAVARRFTRSRTVVGYEIMNEPLVLGATDPEAVLLAFYRRVVNAVRRVDRRHLIAFEPNVIRNVTNAAPIPAKPFPDPRALYAPHIYTDVFDGRTYASGDPAELAPSMVHAAAEAAAWKTPLLVGEYGIDPAAAHANDWITAELDLQDTYRAHSAFWVWEETSQGRWGLFDGEDTDPGGERVARTTALSRVYARAVPGTVLEHRFDATANTLRLRWRPAGTQAPLELFVPARRYPHGFTVQCNGAPIAAAADASGLVRLRCGDGKTDRLVELAPAG